MGEIIHSKTSKNNKMIYRILVNEEEARSLKGHMKNIHLFAYERCNVDIKILERGNNKGAKYFIVPKCFRTRKKKRYCKIYSQKIRNDNRIFFVYTVIKNLLF